MLQDIQPYRYNIAYKQAKPGPDDVVIVMKGNAVLLVDEAEAAHPPSYAELKNRVADIDSRLVYLFAVDDAAFFYLADALEEPAGFRYRDFQFFRDYQPSWEAFACVTACHLAQWYGKNRFCGSCGGGMQKKEDERAVHCGACGATVYPAISPAVIVGITDGDRLLMTRYANRPYSRLALVAGFMEVGETLEDTVHREVMEEVGLRIKNIRYYKSQPWAFSSSVLVGFFAELDGSPDITLDTSELQEALWVARGDIPPPESTIALTSEMVNAFRLGTVS